jgi:dolichyl-phosphate-mannose-protein mannosyltransferase
MATTATPSGSVRHRNVPGSSKKKDVSSAQASAEAELDKLSREAQAPPAGSERDYRSAFFFITLMAFVTRFWGINHPKEVVFDEVHFGKVGAYHLDQPLRDALFEMALTSNRSSLPTISRERTSSTCIRPSESSCSR